MSTGSFSRYPLGLARIAGYLAVKCHGVFHGNKGESRRYEVKEYLVESVALLSQHSFRYLYAVAAEYLGALSCYKGIGVRGAYKYTLDAVGYDSFRAGGLLAVMAAGLQRDVHIRAFTVYAAFVAVCKCGAFCVEVTVFFVIACAYYLTVTDDDCSNHRIGRGESHAFPCKFKSLSHIVFVSHVSSSLPFPLPILPKFFM